MSKRRIRSATRRSSRSVRSRVAASPSNRHAERLLDAYEQLRQGDLDSSQRVAADILEIDPTHADAWHLMGMALHCRGQHSMALESLDKAVAFDQHENATIQCTRGSILAALGRHREAIPCYELATRRQPQLIDALSNLSQAYLALHDLDAAESSARRAIRLDPERVSAWNTLGTTLSRRGQLDESEKALQHAIHLVPNDVRALVSYGIVLLEQQRTEEAIAALHCAIAIDSRCAPAFHNMGHALVAYGRFPDAVTCFRVARTLDPNYASDYLFTLSHDPSATDTFVSQEHREWGVQFEEIGRGISHANHPAPDRRLRIGYVSADFRDHVMARYIRPVLTYHDRAAFEVFAYASVSRPDATTEELQSHADHWRDISSCDDDQAARRIRDDQIDILVDLSGHTAGNRLPLFARKPAPVQITWLGYSNTTGLAAMDYRIANTFQDPPETSELHTERFMHVAGEGVCCELPINAPPVSSPPVEQNQFVTFGSLHRLNKLTSSTLDVWCQILHAVPDSRLLVFWPTLHGERRERLQHEFHARGIVADRLDMRCQAGPEGYLAQYHAVDIGLDVFQWTGSTTTREALWMGVVVLAHSGTRRKRGDRRRCSTMRGYRNISRTLPKNMSVSRNSWQTNRNGSRNSAAACGSAWRIRLAIYPRKCATSNRRFAVSGSTGASPQKGRRRSLAERLRPGAEAEGVLPASPRGRLRDPLFICQE